MCVALTNRGIPFVTEKAIPVGFEGVDVAVHKLDMVVHKEIVLALKAVKEIADVHRNQLRSYLRASKLRIGLLINFNSSPLFIRRLVN
jgi:GxxExxY protein